MKRIYILAISIFCTGLFAQHQPLYKSNQTPTYEEVMAQYEKLAMEFPTASLVQYGATDSGRNLHIFYINSEPLAKEGLEEAIRTKVVLLINNGIHAGETCGIDASLVFAREILQKGIPENVLLAIIPVYNIGGALNRGQFSRANQLGPEEHGFRGNARNLDLNRDFIKADALNTLSFYAIFQYLKPHIFVDTHTSDGADYQYTMTLISTQKDKLNPVLSKVLTDDMEPFLYQKMAGAGWRMTPYVDVFGSTPDKGYGAFLETPRYASGYTALFNTMGFITETHMLKPYADRVESTRQFLHIMTDYCEKNAKKLITAKKEAWAYDRSKKIFDLQWKQDSSKVSSRKFEGYEYEYVPSIISGAPRLRYLRDKPKTFDIPYYGSFKATDSVNIPAYYVVPQAWRLVPERLQYNGVKMTLIKKDTTIKVTSYYIKNAEFSQTPYEGHFPIKKMTLEKKVQERKFLKGDYLVPTDQQNIRFIVSVLEPSAVDSYLRWNFYDEIFQQKEYFSPYVFEETAASLLEQNPELKAEFEDWKKANPNSLSDPIPDLLFIYQHSPYYEKEHLRYPVARIE